MTRFLKNRIFLLLLILSGLTAVFLYGLEYDGLLTETLAYLRNSMDKGERLREAILAKGALAPLLFIGIQALQVVIAPIPGEASGIFGGYLFGAPAGFVYSSIGLGLGSWLAFVIGRLLSDLVRRRLEQTRIYQRFNHLVCRGDFVIPFILFLLPGFPKDSLAYLLGMSHMPLPVFLFIAVIGRMPGTILLSLQGAQAQQGHFGRLALLLALSAAIAIPCTIFRHRLFGWLAHHSRRTFGEQGDNCRGSQEKE